MARAAEVGVRTGNRMAVSVSTLQAHDADLRVAVEDADQLATDEAGRTDDADTDGGASRR